MLNSRYFFVILHLFLGQNPLQILKIVLLLKTEITSSMSELTSIKEYIEASWLHIPSQSFEKMGLNEHSRITYNINKQIMDSIYSRFPTWKQSYIWMQFESLINGILHDLRTIVSDETCGVICIGTLHALQPKWLILREMLKSITDLGYSYCHIFADRVGLLHFYEQQARLLVEQIPKYKDCIYDNDQQNDLCGTNEVCIDGERVLDIYSALFITTINDSYVQIFNKFLTSLDCLPDMLHDFAFSQTYYLFKNTHSLYTNVEIFQTHDFGIYHSRRSIFLQEYKNIIKKLSRKENVPNPDNNSTLREEAFTETMHRLYSESFPLYEEYRSMLEYQNDGEDYTEEGRLRTFFTNLFQTHYVGEQCDTEGNITKVLVDVKGNTTVEGKSGWERWVDFLSVIALVREYEQRCLPVESSVLKNSSNDSVQMPVSCLKVDTIIVNRFFAEGKNYSRYPKCLSIEYSTSLYLFLRQNGFIDGEKTPLADFNYLMGAADQYTTPDKPKPICWLKNKQILREMLFLAFAPLINNGSTKKSITDLAPDCFVDKKGKTLKLGKNDERQIVTQDINALKDFFSDLIRPE